VWGVPIASMAFAVPARHVACQQVHAHHCRHWQVPCACKVRLMRAGACPYPAGAQTRVACPALSLLAYCGAGRAHTQQAGAWLQPNYSCAMLLRTCIGGCHSQGGCMRLRPEHASMAAVSTQSSSTLSCGQERTSAGAARTHACGSSQSDPRRQPRPLPAKA